MTRQALLRVGLPPDYENTAGSSPPLNGSRIWFDSRIHEMKVIAEVAASLLLALIVLRASGSLFGVIYEWKLRARKS